MSSAEEMKDELVIKLIFAVIAALFAVMTGIGGATASHMITQNDDILKRLSTIESSIAAQDVYRIDIERRVESLEKQQYERKKN